MVNARSAPAVACTSPGLFSKTLLVMSRLLIYSLCTLFSISFSISLSAQRKVHVVDVTTRQPIENVVVTDAQSGKVLGITPQNGCFLSTSQAKKLSFSHLSYQPLAAPVADTVPPRPTRLPNCGIGSHGKSCRLLQIARCRAFLSVRRQHSGELCGCRLGLLRQWQGQ